MARVHTWDPKRVTVSFGANLLTGFADGTFVKWERDEDSFQKKTGADGETARAASNNRGGKVKFTLMQSSASNDVLSNLSREDELLRTGIRTLIVKDLNGTTLLHADSAWLTRPADGEMGKELSDREWVIDCAELNPYVGGLTF